MDFVGNDGLDIAVAVNETAGLLNGALLHLSQLDITPTRDTTLLDLSAAEADYNTYAALEITWNDPSISDDGFVEAVGIVPEFRPTDDLAPNSIYTAYITDSTGDNLLFAGRLDNPPAPMGPTTDSLILTVRWRPRTYALGVEVS